VYIFVVKIDGATTLSIMTLTLTTLGMRHSMALSMKRYYHNDTQHNATRHNETQHETLMTISKRNCTTLSIIAFSIMPLSILTTNIWDTKQSTYIDMAKVVWLSVIRPNVTLLNVWPPNRYLETILFAKNDISN